jgi:AcrR family transcriptional regulator
MSDILTEPAGARQPLTQASIVAAAIAIADEGGIAALSMRKLAQRLGVEAMSLYNHIDNKEALLSAMVEGVVAGFAPPRPDAPWKAELHRRAVTAHQQLCSHPWANALLVSRPNMGAGMLAYIEATLDCLVHAGFSLTDADHAWNTMDSHIYGFTLQKLNFPFAPDDYAEAAATNIDRIPEDRFPCLHGLAELVARRQYNGLHDLDHGLRLILDGLEAQLEKQKGRPGSPHRPGKAS